MTSIPRHVLILAILAAAGPARAEEPAPPPSAPAPASDGAGGTAAPALPSDPAALEAARAETYERFKALVAEGRYAKAVPVAREVVAMTAALDAHHEDLPTAWNNLGVAQLRAADPRAALESFTKALDLVESAQGIGSRRLIAPMAGLGAAYNALGDPARAATEFERAVSVSRRASGLFNLEQLDLMDALIQAYTAVGLDDGIDRERRYALQVVEKRYGYGDPRTLPRVTQLAEWYESTGRYAAARLLHKRALDIASRESGGRNVSTINALVAVARTHRLQFAEDPESLVETQETSPQYAESIGGTPVSRVRTTASAVAVQAPVHGRVKIDEEGRDALDQALKLLETSADPPPALMSRTLLELGDWMMTAGSTAEGLGYYERAWPLLDSLAAAGTPNPLAAPRRLVYRAPGGQKRGRLIEGADVVELRGDFRVDVDATGTPVNVESVGGNLSEMQSAQVQRSLRRSVFSPAYADGKPVATPGYLLSETWIDYRKDYESRSGGDGGTAGEGSPPPEASSSPGADVPAGPDAGGEAAPEAPAAGSGTPAPGGTPGGGSPPPDSGEAVPPGS